MALIGAGGIGGYHLESIRKFEERGLLRLLAVADPMLDRFAELKRNLESRGVRWYSDYRDLLRAESELDAVTIAAPIHLHFEMARACLERGLYVNLEKPPVPTVQQLETLVAADRHQRVTVGFQMILSKGVQRLKQAIVDGAVGEVRSIRASGCWPRREPYYKRAPWAGRMTLRGQPIFDGPATNAMAHVVHNIMFLAGASMAGYGVPNEVQGELYRARQIESYDIACLRGTFPSGVEFSFALTHATKELRPFKIEVRGSKGWLRLSKDGEHLESSSGDSHCLPGGTQELLDACYERLIEIVPGRQRTYASLTDTIGYVRTTNGLFLSSGGIHDIAPEYITQYGEGADVGVSVSELAAASERVFSEGKLFSEFDLPWATARPVAIALDSFDSIDLNEPQLVSLAG